jgi:hypothetical protein
VKNIKLYKEWLAEAFADKHPKNKYVELPHSDVMDYADNIIDLINKAYASKGGNIELRTSNDLKNSDLTYWIAKDFDADPEADVAIGGKKTPSGTKLTVIGQDTSSAGKKEAVVKMIELMKTRGFYAELDVDLADKLGLKRIKDEKEIRNVLNKDITYNSDGSYSRMLGGSFHTKVLVGIPK